MDLLRVIRANDLQERIRVIAVISRPLSPRRG